MYRGNGRRDILNLAARWRLLVPLDIPESRNILLYLQHSALLLKINNQPSN
jgi:hypothetical protein